MVWWSWVTVILTTHMYDFLNCFIQFVFVCFKFRTLIVEIFRNPPPQKKNPSSVIFKHNFSECISHSFISFILENFCRFFVSSQIYDFKISANLRFFFFLINIRLQSQKLTFFHQNITPLLQLVCLLPVITLIHNLPYCIMHYLKTWRCAVAVLNIWRRVYLWFYTQLDYPKCADLQSTCVLKFILLSVTMEQKLKG